jgi:hypothetical protein
MRVGPLRRGELLVGLGLAGLVVTLFLDLFSVDPGARCDVGRGVSPEACAVLVRMSPAVGVDGGWGALGHPWLEFVALLGLGLVVVLALAVRAARPGRPTYGAVVAGILALAGAALVLLLTAIRVLLARPDATLTGIADSPSVPVGTGVAFGGWLLLASILVALAGLWVAMADDRTAAPESAYAPPQPRPVPPLRPGEPGSTPPAE